MAFKKVKEIAANIPTSSMADIAFLLIIFFMVTTKFDVDRTRVDLPKSAIRDEVPPDSAYVVVHGSQADGWGYKFSDGEAMSTSVPDISVLEAQIAQVTATDPGTYFVIKAEADVPYKRIDGVIDVLRSGGASDVVLLTEQRTVDDQ